MDYGTLPQATAPEYRPGANAPTTCSPVKRLSAYGRSLHVQAHVLQLSFQVFGDEFAVEAAVLDEDFVGALAGYDDASEVDAGNVGFERGRVAEWAARVGLVQCDAEALDELEVRVVAGEREDEVVANRERAGRRLQRDLVFGDVGDAGVEVSRDLAVLDAIIDVGQDPVLHMPVHLRPAV